MRDVPEALRQRYLDEGWWTDASLGDMVADGLDAKAAAPFEVHSKVHPWSGTFGDVDRAARSLARSLRDSGVVRGSLASRRAGASAPATSSCSSYRTGSRPASRSGRLRTSARSSCRSSTSTAPRRWSTSSEPPNPMSSSPPTGSATSITSRCTSRCSSIIRTRAGWSPGRAADRARPPGATSFASLLDGEPDRRTGGGRSRRAGDHRVHIRHDARSEGRHPFAPHDRVRDPPARLLLSRRRPGADHGCAVDRPDHGARSAISSAWSTRSSSRCCATGRSISSTCGIRARSCA